jgi:hypothetical protein
MFIKKDKNEEDSADVKIVSRPFRYDNTMARVAINGFEGEALLKNISVGGFCMESGTFAALGVGEQYIINITPENNSRLSSFDLEIEVRWIKSTEKNFMTGFLIINPSGNRSLEKYIEYVKNHSQHY